MRKVWLVLLGALVFLGGCDLGLTGSGPASDTGSLRIAVSKDAAFGARSLIAPDVIMEISQYRISAAGPSPLTYGPVVFQSNQDIVISSLYRGTWIFQVQGLNADGVVIGMGSRSVQIQSNQTATTTITVVPLAGNGTLELALSWPASVMTAPAIQASLTGQDGTAQALTLALDGSAGTATYSGQWPAGYYDLVIELFDGSRKVWGSYQAVRILSEVTSSGTVALTVNEMDLSMEGQLELVIDVDLQNPPEVILSGQEAVLVYGASMTVQAQVDPAGSYEYQWYLDGVIIDGQTSPQITLGSDLMLGVYQLDIRVQVDSIVASNGCRFVVAEQIAAYQDTSDTTTTDVSATVAQVTPDASGSVDGYISFTDQSGNPILNLNAFNFQIEESLDQAAWVTLSSGSIIVTSVSNSGQAISTALTMDYSGSMSATDISNMETATSIFISNMGPSDQAAMLKFGETVHAYPTSGFSTNTTELQNYVTTAFPGYDGATALFDAVGQGLELLNNTVSTGLKAVIAFTDGSDNASSSWNEQSVINYSNTNSIPIYSIGFGSANTSILSSIATSGVYTYSPDSAGLSDIYDQIANRMQETYVVEWETIGTSGDVVFVRISVTYTAAHGAYTETVTTSYTM